MKLSAISMRALKALQPDLGGTRSAQRTKGMSFGGRDAHYFLAMRNRQIRLSRTSFSEPLARAATSAYTRGGRKMHADPRLWVGAVGYVSSAKNSAERA
jgi:hypothetical protein